MPAYATGEPDASGLVEAVEVVATLVQPSHPLSSAHGTSCADALTDTGGRLGQPGTEA